MYFLFTPIFGLSNTGLIALIVELCIIAYVVKRQLSASKETREQIKAFQESIPEIEESSTFLRVLVNVPTKEINTQTAETIVKSLWSYVFNSPLDNTEKINFVSMGKDLDQVHPFSETINSINTYLLRNKGGVADFNLIKDIVERKTAAEDNDINLSLSTPLYWGLLGTMAGIVVGLLIFVFTVNFTFSDTVAGNDPASGIKELLFGVCFGMTASAIGLFMTIRNSVSRYKGAKSIVEWRKNQFYTFIQTDMLPVLSHDVATSFNKLELSVQNFNEDFSKNIRSLKTLMSGHSKTISEQAQILEMLRTIDLEQFATVNVNLFHRLQSSFGQLEQFQRYLIGMNDFVGTTQSLSTTLKDILTRTDNFQAIAEDIAQSVGQNQQLTNYLYSHFEEIQHHKKVITEHMQITSDDFNRTNTVMIDNMGKGLSGLSEDYGTKLNEFRRFVTEQDEVFRRATSAPANSLDHLKYLKTMNENMELLKRQMSNNDDRLVLGLNQLSNNMIQLVDWQKKIYDASQESYLDKVKHFWRSLFITQVKEKNSTIHQALAKDKKNEEVKSNGSE